MGFQPGLHIKKREGKERMEEIEGEKERRGERGRKGKRKEEKKMFSPFRFFFLSMKRSAATKDLMHLFFFQYAEKFLSREH